MANTIALQRWFLIIKIVLSAGFLMSASTNSIASSLLSQYLWKNRVLLLSAPSWQNQQLVAARKQIEMMQCGIDDRDLVIGFIITGQGAVFESHSINEHQVTAIKEELRIDKDSFTIILIGKDGGEKYRSDHLNMPRIFDLIDGMPMRQEEMIHSSSDCS